MVDVGIFVVVTVWGSVEMFVVYQPLLKVFFVLKYVVCVGGVIDVVFSVCIVRGGALGTCVWEV